MEELLPIPRKRFQPPWLKPVTPAKHPLLPCSTITNKMVFSGIQRINTIADQQQRVVDKEKDFNCATGEEQNIEGDCSSGEEQNIEKEEINKNQFLENLIEEKGEIELIKPLMQKPRCWPINKTEDKQQGNGCKPFSAFRVLYCKRSLKKHKTYW